MVSLPLTITNMPEAMPFERKNMDPELQKKLKKDQEEYTKSVPDDIQGSDFKTTLDALDALKDESEYSRDHDIMARHILAGCEKEEADALYDVLVNFGKKAQPAIDVYEKRF